LLEALMSAGVLGIGLLGLIRLHSSAIHSFRDSHERADATYIAQQIAEVIAAQANGAPPDCPPVSPDPGCRQGSSAVDAHDFAPRTACSTWYGSSGLPDPSGSFRVDRVVLKPAEERHPTSEGYPPPYLLSVYVCWLDDQNQVRQIQTSRFVPSGT
jgi:Tfp pilus assembly protein PilV